MLDLSKTKLPREISLDGSSFILNTDFRFWLRFSQLQNDGLPHTYEDYNFVYKGDKPHDLEKAFPLLFDFYAPKREFPRPTRGGSSDKVLDYFVDADLIYSSFMELYSIDLMDEELRLHWWKFLALLSGVHGTKLSEVVGFRCYDEHDKSEYKDIMRENREAWRLEQPLSPEEKKALDHFDSIFG